MSEFETTRNTRTMVIAIVVIAIIGVAGVSIMLLGTPPGPNGNTTGTTTTTDTTTEPTIPPGDVELAILTRHDIGIQGKYESAFLQTDFAKDNNIVNLKWRAPANEFWDDFIIDGQADILWGGGPTLFDQLNSDGYLEPLTSPLMQAAADLINDTIAGVEMKRNNTSDELVWVAAAISTFGFTVNNAFLTDYSLPTPTTWTDLADPVWASLLPTIPTIAMGNAPGTTSNTRIYEIITQALGWDAGWSNMARMAGSAEIYGGSVDTQSAVESGEVGVAMSIDFYGYLSQAVNPDCQYIVPEGQSIVNGDPIAIPNTSTKKDLAEGFVNFVLSPEGQAIWLDNDLRRMPVMREAFDVPGLTGVEDLYLAFNRTTQTIGIDFDDLLSLGMNRAFIKYWESVFTDSHADLVNCWTAIILALDEERISPAEFDTYVAQMGAMITVLDATTSIAEEFTIAYATSINHDMIYNTAYASSMQSRWTAAAKIQYITVKAAVDAET